MKKFLPLVFLIMLTAIAISHAKAEYNARQKVVGTEQMNKSLIADVLADKKPGTGGQVDIKDILEKYFQLGMSKQAATNYLTGEGFKLYFTPAKGNQPDSVLGIWEDKSLINDWGSHKEIRVILDFDSDKITKIQGMWFIRTI